MSHPISEHSRSLGQKNSSTADWIGSLWGSSWGGLKEMWDGNCKKSFQPTAEYSLGFDLLYERKCWCLHRGSKHAPPCVHTVPDVDCSLDEVLEAGWTAPIGAQALLHGGHKVFQVLREVLVLITEKVNLQCCLVDLWAVLSFRHPVPDPQHLHCGVVTGVHQVEEIVHKLLAQEDGQLPRKALVVPQNHIQDHEESINGAGVF